jgi:hypothetical protein
MREGGRKRRKGFKEGEGVGEILQCTENGGLKCKHLDLFLEGVGVSGAISRGATAALRYRIAAVHRGQ